MNQSCPNCKCEETDLLSLAFYTEMLNLPARGHGTVLDAVRLLLGIGPPFPKRYGGPESLLHKVAPPRRLSYYPILACWFLITLAVTVVPTIVGTIVGYAALFIAGFSLDRARRFNINRWPLLFEKWEHSYICRNCGRLFETGADSPGG